MLTFFKSTKGRLCCSRINNNGVELLYPVADIPGVPTLTKLLRLSAAQVAAYQAEYQDCQDIRDVCLVPGQRLSYTAVREWCAKINTRFTFARTPEGLLVARDTQYIRYRGKRDRYRVVSLRDWLRHKDVPLLAVLHAVYVQHWRTPHRVAPITWQNAEEYYSVSPGDRQALYMLWARTQATFAFYRTPGGTLVAEHNQRKRLYVADYDYRRHYSEKEKGYFRAARLRDWLTRQDSTVAFDVELMVRQAYAGVTTVLPCRLERNTNGKDWLVREDSEIPYTTHTAAVAGD